MPTIDSSGTSVTYPEVWPLVDVHYEVTDWAVQQRIILKSGGARTDFPFLVEGGKLQGQGDGAFRLMRPDGPAEGLDRGSIFSLSGATLNSEGAAPIPVGASVLPSGGADATAESGRSAAVESSGGARTSGVEPETTVVSVTVDESAVVADEASPATVSSALQVSQTISPTSDKRGIDDTSGIVGGINLASGNYTAEALDASVPVVGPPLEVRRFYNTQYAYDDRCSCGPDFTSSSFGGQGWSTKYDMFAEHKKYFSPEIVQIYREDSRIDVYVKTGSGTWESPPGTRAKLTGVPGQNLVLTEADGSSTLFDPSPTEHWSDLSEFPQDKYRVAEFRDPEGQRQVLEYDESWIASSYQRGQNVMKATDVASGRYLQFEWYHDPNSVPLHLMRVVTKVTAHAKNGTILGAWNYQYWHDPATVNQQYGSYIASDLLLAKVFDPANDPSSPTAEPTTYSYWATADSSHPGAVWGYLKDWRRPDGSTEVSLEYGNYLQAPGCDYNSGCKPYRATRHIDGDGDSLSVGYAFVSAGPERTTATVTDERGIVAEWAFDSQGRLARRRNKSASPNTERKWYFYPSDSDPATVDGLLQLAVHEDNSNEQYWYDARGNPTAVKDRYGSKSYSTYDSADRLVEQRDPRSSSASDRTYLTTMEYDGTSRRVKKITPPSSAGAPLAPSTFEYTAGTEAASGGGLQPAGLLKRKVSPSEGTTTYSYRSDGDLDQMVDGKGLTTTYTHDVFGREKQRTESGTGVPAATWTTEYDAAGRISFTTEPAVVNPVDGQFRQLKRTTTYDVNGWVRRVDESDVAHPTVTRYTTTDYYDDGLEKSVTSWVSGTDTVSSSTEYDGAGNPTAVVDQNGNRYERTYDVYGNPDKVILKDYKDDPLSAQPGSDLVVLDQDYDPSGRLTKSVDAEGRITMNSQFDVGDQPGMVTLLGFKERNGSTSNLQLQLNEFDDAGNLTKRKDGNNLRTTTYTYYPSGLRASEEIARSSPYVVDQRTEWTYNSGGLQESETRKGLGIGSDRQTRTFYKSFTSVVSRTEQEAGSSDLVTEFTTDARGNPTTKLDAEGDQTTYGYDAVGRQTTETLPSVMVESNGSTPAAANPVTKTGYDVYGRVIAKRDANGNTTTFEYDGLDRQVRISHPSYTPVDGSATLAPVEVFAYDGVGNLVSKTDRRGRVSSFSFDRMNRAYMSVTPGTSPGTPAVETTVYDRVGNVKKATLPSGAVVEHTYDMLNRERSVVETVRQPTQTVSTTWFDYDRLGNRTWVQNAQGKVSTATFSSNGSKLTETDPYGKTTTFTVSPFGETLKVLDATGRCHGADYDVAGRKVKEISGCQLSSSEQLVSTFGYDKVGRLTAKVSAEGRPATSTYDAAGRLSSVVVGSGGEAATTSYFYDAAGNNTRVRNGRGNEASSSAYDTILRYQSWNLEESRIEPQVRAGQAVADRTWSTVYDAGGLPVKDVQPGGVSISRSFDESGRPTTEVGAGAGGSRAIGYDVAGRVTSVSSPTGAISVSYNDRDQPLSVSGGGSAAAYAYESWGALKTRTDAAGTSAFAYDDAGRLKSQSDPLTGGQAEFFYDDAGRQAYRILNAPGETSVSAATTVTGRSFDAYGRVSSEWSVSRLEQLFSTVPEYYRRYGYDRDGLVVSEALLGSQVDKGGSYTYTSLGQLKSYTPLGGAEVAYGYDKAGNRTKAGSLTFSFDAQNRVSGGGGTTYSWSDRGTVASSTTGATTAAYTFDAFGQETAAGSVTYQRDGLGRIAKRNSQLFSYSGLDRDVCNDGTTLVNHDLGGQRPVSVRVGGTNSWAITDVHADVVALLNPQGELSGTRGYDPYGVVEGSEGSFGATIGFQSDWTDPTTKEVNMGARMYMPQAATFSSRDTYAGQLATPVSLNRYTYAHNNPLSYLDPTGSAVELNPYTMTEQQYGLVMEANLLEYKQHEFMRMIKFANDKGYSDEQTKFLLAVHFQKVVEPNVRRERERAVAEWQKVHPETNRKSVPTGGAGHNGGSNGGADPYAGRARKDGEFEYRQCGNDTDWSCLLPLYRSVLDEMTLGRGIQVDCGIWLIGSCTYRLSRNLTAMLDELIDNNGNAILAAVLGLIIVQSLLIELPGLGALLGGATGVALWQAFKLSVGYGISSATNKGACASLTLPQAPVGGLIHTGIVAVANGLSDNGKLCTDGRGGREW